MTSGPGFGDGRAGEWAGQLDFDGFYGRGRDGQSDPDADYLMGGADRALFGGPGADLLGTSMSGDFDDFSSTPVQEVEQSWPEYEPDEESSRDPLVETGSLVRPYARTGGRTRPDYDLPIEALISTSDRGRERNSMSLAEHRSICGLCIETRSVAEIAAHLRLPLGVVRVLIGDMASLGLVLVHNSGLVMGDGPSLAFLERVLSGLRRL
ncbi:hypothetical protein FHR81_005078 [Actinoalloteichus hoggarensis]|uniref:Uncharacterized protein n=1 Tax=Actinoalloteichus hoggarensis TaxID=1470176 RepID=A0A221WC47_9PSEU|nr:DUF742 domain-containing protein [Actinoalloteichus hoggarensis]ASO22857.1 hypothetical protein AHOG_26260 [Actinoalloteichus hoggarensis]MBB5924001.1 hypothetical protein [Actinoalloteichus hoggarensis]